MAQGIRGSDVLTIKAFMEYLDPVDPMSTSSMNAKHAKFKSRVLHGHHSSVLCHQRFNVHTGEVHLIVSLMEHKNKFLVYCYFTMENSTFVSCAAAICGLAPHISAPISMLISTGPTTEKGSQKLYNL